jgi:mannosylglycerate hydrolase
MKKKIHILSYTHWDREFRFDFENTRIRLVELMDNLVEIFRTKPDYKHFMLDGQYLLVEDYLEIRPEMREELEGYAKAGRLGVGPWYSLPDSSTINGESLLRNLMMGLKKSREFGGTVEAGYNVFSFGQIAQLPQIYKGFGIEFIAFYKNMSADRAKYSEFMWEAPDGSQILTTKLDCEARWNFFFAGHIPIVYGMDAWHKDWQYEMGTLGKSFHMCEPENYASFHFISEPENSFKRENIKMGFERAIGTIKKTLAPNDLLFFDGTDFTEPHPLIPEIIKAANEELGDEYEIVHAPLKDYIEALKADLKDTKLETVKGEMRDGPVGSVHTDVCSIHPELKRGCGIAENKLYRWAEPFNTLAFLEGAVYPKTHFESTQKYLFKAQAHDSMHGVGPADMCKDIENRLLQAKVISEATTQKAFEELAAKVDTSKIDTDIFVMVYNPSAQKRSETVEVYLDIPKTAVVDKLIIEDEQGNKMQLHQISKTDARAGLYHPRSRNMPIYTNRYHILFNAENIPALGYKTFAVKWSEKNQYPYPHEDWDKVLVPFETLVTGQYTAENSFVKLQIAGDGTFALTNKETNETINNLNYFIDSGDCGNLYLHQPPAYNTIESTLGGKARIALVLNTPLVAVFEIHIAMMLPKAVDFAKNKRAEELVEVPIKTVVTLKRDSDVVEVETTVDNKVKDHFLRVCFPTGINTTHTDVEANFEVNRYLTRSSKDGDFKGQELTRHRSQLFVDLSDGQKGFAILNEATRDYEIIDADNGTIALSVVRGVRLRIPCDNRLWMEYPGDDSSQSLREHTMKYGICFHKGNWEEGEVYQKALKFNTPLRTAQIGKHSGTLPFSKGYLQVEPSALAVTAVKKAQDRNSIIVRVFNPTDKTIKANMQTGFDYKETYLVNLNEERQEKIQSASNGTIEMKITGKKIVTIEFIL